MKISKKMGNLIFIGFVVIIFLFFRFCVVPNPKFDIEKINKSFQGRFIKTYFLKSNHYVFQIGKDQYDTGFLAFPLIDVIQVGDSIVKFPNDNKCKLYRNNQQIYEGAFIFVAEVVRENYTWPEKWRNKPREWYGE